MCDHYLNTGDGWPIWGNGQPKLSWSLSLSIYLTVTITGYVLESLKLHCDFGINTKLLSQKRKALNSSFLKWFPTCS